MTLEWAELNGMGKGLTKDLEEETLLNIMVAEAIKSSAIEGEFYSREDFMSSFKNKLGLSKTLLKVIDRNAVGIAELMIEVRKTFREPLSMDLLKNWHQILFPHAKILLVGKMFDAGPDGFQGGMSAKKYMSITQVSKATATRDLQYLDEQGMLTKSCAER